MTGRLTARRAVAGRSSVRRTVRRTLGGALGGVVLALAVPGAGYADPALAVSDVAATAGQVDFAVSVQDVPAGADLAEATVSVTAAGHDLPAAVSVAGAAPQPGVSAPAPGAGGPPARGAVVVFDASGSMAEGDALAAARAAARGYARALPADVRLGLVAVSGKPTTLVRPTVDRRAFAGALARIAAEGDTALYDGIRLAVGLLPEGERRIVVLSDGRDTASKTTLAALASRLKDVPVDVVSLGSEIDHAAVRRITEASGGRRYAADDTSALAGAFREAARLFTGRLLVTAQVPEALAGRQVPMRVDVSVAGVDLTATVPVRFAAVTRSTGAGPAVVAPAVPTWLTWLVVGVVFVALFTVFLAVAGPLIVGAPRRRRISQFDRYVGGRAGMAVAGAPGALTRTALAWSDRAVRMGDREERTVHRLDRAGMTLRPAEWLLIRVCVGFTTTVVLWLLLPWWAGIPLGLVLGSLGTWLYRRVRTRRRVRRFADQLPDALQLVIGSLRSGFSLAQALAALVRESGGPIAGEFGRALAETRLGSELEDALERVVSRTDCEDLAWAVMAVRIQRQVGGNLAEVLQNAVDMMRERGRLRRHVRALSAEGRLSAYILIGLPIALFGYMLLVRREYVSLLYTTALGIVMLVFAGLLVAVGGFVMSRLVKVEV